jgi:translation initiation factor IF-2
LIAGRGSVPTVLVQQGTLRVGDPFIAGQVFGKVRAMFDDRGQAVTEVGPATPVEILGLQGVPQAGDTFQVVADITRAQSISSHRQQLTRQNALLSSTKRGIEALGEREIKSCSSSSKQTCKVLSKFSSQRFRNFQPTR